MTKEEWCEIWSIPQDQRDSAWAEKLAMDSRTGAAPAVLADIPDFVSTVDGSIVRGRAGMREHCARHNVIPNQELAGLKPRTFGQGTPALSPLERDTRKRIMHQILDQRYHHHIK